MFETDFKKVIALRTLSQVRLIIVAQGLGLPTYRLFHLYTHAMFKALLFICAGVVIHHVGTQDIRRLGNLARTPIVGSCLLLTLLRLIGIPFLAGYYSKEMIVLTQIGVQGNMFLLVQLILSISLTSIYSARLAYLVILGESSSPSAGDAPVTRMEIALFYILGFTVIVGRALNSFMLDFISTDNPVELRKIPLFIVILGLGLSLHVAYR